MNHEVDNSNATVFNGAADAVAVVDEVVGIPELFHSEEPLVVATKVPRERQREERIPFMIGIEKGRKKLFRELIIRGGTTEFYSGNGSIFYAV